MVNQIQNLLASVTSYKYVSFDVFDTLIFRTFSHYSDLFEMVESLYNKRHQNHIRCFKKERIEAEREARHLANGKEVTINDIYNQLHYNNSIKKELQNIEELSEIDNCVSNKIMVDFLRECKHEGKNIIIITDMYLPRSIIANILEKIGVEYDALFISGEERVTKRSGELYKIVLKRLGIKPTELIHFGDDANNDIKQPKRLGITAMERAQDKIVPIPYWKEKDAKNIYSEHLCELLRRGIQSYADSPEVVLGYTIIGPILWEFCQWVHQLRVSIGLDRLLFVAREGWLIMECYSKMFPEERNTIEYVRLNKNILRLPSLFNGDRVEKFIRSIPGRITLEWRDIFKYLGVEDLKSFASKIHKRYPNTNIHDRVKIKDISFREKKIINFAIDLQKETIEKQHKMLLSYLEVLGVTKQKVGLVNNSINGSGQSLIEEYLKSEGKSSGIYGLQFIRSKKCISLLQDRSVGWINVHMKPSFATNKFISLSLIFEHLLFEPQGTALRLDKGVDGKIIGICEQPRKEVSDFDKIASVQKYALKFIEDYQSNIQHSTFNYGFKRLLRMLLNPRMEEAMFVGTIWDDDVEEDKQILNMTASFRKHNCLLKDLPTNIGWIEGWLEINNVPKRYKIIAYLRQLIRYYRHHIPLVNNEY